MPSILSYFRSTETANAVKEILKEKGAKEIQVDQLTNLFPHNDYENVYMQHHDSMTLSNTLGDTGKEVGINTLNDIGQHSVILTVITSDDNHEDFVNTISQYGGLV